MSGICGAGGSMNVNANETFRTLDRFVRIFDEIFDDPFEEFAIYFYENFVFFTNKFQPNIFSKLRHSALEVTHDFRDDLHDIVYLEIGNGTYFRKANGDAIEPFDVAVDFAGDLFYFF